MAIGVYRNPHSRPRPGALRLRQAASRRIGADAVSGQLGRASAHLSQLLKGAHTIRRPSSKSRSAAGFAPAPPPPDIRRPLRLFQAVRRLYAMPRFPRRPLRAVRSAPA